MSNKKSYPNWTQEEDNIVREAVIQSKKEGKSLKYAFTQASKQINRTVGSISFRWNNKLKHQFISNKKPVPKNYLDLQDVINYLNDIHEKASKYEQLKIEYENLLESNNKFQNKFNNLTKIIS